MHILYVDESGAVENPQERVFVLGGIAVFERGIYHLIKEVDDCVAAFGFDGGEEIELHASEMYSGRGIWRSIPRKNRESCIRSALTIVERQQQSVRLFAVAVDKAAVSPRDAVEVAFEEICNRFNLYLQRHRNRRGEDQKGLIVMDESKFERPLQSLARSFRTEGGTWGHFRHLAEVPLFVDSRASRIVQLADLVAWATWRRYEHFDGRFFDPLIPRFDADGGVIHGLFHACSTLSDECYCPGCHSRRSRDRFAGPPES